MSCDRGRVSLRPVGRHDISKGIEEGVLTEQFTQFVSAFRLYVIHDPGHDKANAFLLQDAVQRTQRFRGRVVHIVDRRTVEAEPAQRRLRVVDQACHFLGQLLAVGVVHAVREAVDQQPRCGLYRGAHGLCLPGARFVRHQQCVSGPVTGTAAYLLTIENLSSFNEYTQSIQDSGIVLYTGGFPTKAFQRFYKRVVEQARAPVYRWGDTDPHGFLILKTLQQQVPDISLHPHLMDQPDGAAYSSFKLNELSRILPVNAQVDKLLSQLIDQGVGLVEQEEAEAVAPLR